MIVAVAVHDTTYLVDFSTEHLPFNEAHSHTKDVIADYVIGIVQKYEQDNLAKIVGAGLSEILQSMSPNLCSRLWLDIDVIPIVMGTECDPERPSFWDAKHVDEQSDSMARKCVM